MTRTYFISAIFSFGLCLLSVGCSSKSDNATDSVTETVSTDQSSLSHAPASVLDSMALNADDLNPQQAVNLLMGYVEIYRNSSSNKTKAVTMRKFVDVYDILISNYGDEFRNTVSRAANDSVNLRDISQDFRAKLAGYDEASGMVYEPTVEKDTTTAVPADSISAIED